MATAYYYFNGMSKWAKVYKPDEKYGKYSIDVLLSMEQYEALKNLKVKNNGKPEDGKMWVTFRRNQEDGAPIVVGPDGGPFTDLIGNGSEVSIKLEIESFVSQKYGPVTKSRIASVMVDKHVKYEKTPEVAPDTPIRPRLPF